MQTLKHQSISLFDIFASNYKGNVVSNSHKVNTLNNSISTISPGYDLLLTFDI